MVKVAATPNLSFTLIFAVTQVTDTTQPEHTAC